eukprot:9555768-Lingulodinium_polyedra.AAC.1
MCCLTGTAMCNRVAPPDCARRVMVFQIINSTQANRVIYDARFSRIPVVGIWAGTEVSRWVQQYSSSTRRTDCESFVTKAQHF